MKNRIRVLIVDDSAVVRAALTRILDADPEIEVIGKAADPYMAARYIAKEVPDVITLDIEMPRMDGITFLKKIIQQRPIPVVVISSLTEKASETGLQAMESGAVEVIKKPELHTKEFFEESKIRICDTVKAAAKVNVTKKRSSWVPDKKLPADVVVKKAANHAMVRTTERVVALGASTGGTEAIREVLMALPPDCPGIVIVQHMPENFTRSFANRLNELCHVNVKEAENGDPVIRGHVLIAPGNKHTLLKRSGARYYVEVKDGPLVSRHRPSVDVLFRSTAQFAGKNAIGIIMTGMGDDGARGLLEMREAGAITVAQDEKSSIVYGMPKEAVKLDAAQHILPLSSISDFILRPVRKSALNT